MSELLLENLREDYRQGVLEETNCLPDALAQFHVWMEQAQKAQLREPNAMTLATATPDGRPSARIVLLKELSADGFVFYSNYNSRKGQEMSANQQVALVFYWGELERQVRVEGTVSRLAREKSAAYFRSRPKGSRLGALASHQSEILSSRQPLEQRYAELQAQYADDEIPMPEWWGGYVVWPEQIEFWQGRTSRLHDRLLYHRLAEGRWRIERLSP